MDEKSLRIIYVFYLRSDLVVFTIKKLFYFYMSEGGLHLLDMQKTRCLKVILKSDVRIQTFILILLVAFNGSQLYRYSWWVVVIFCTLSVIAQPAMPGHFVWPSIFIEWLNEMSKSLQ